MRIKRRNGLVSALLGLVTCGLYHIFFWYQYGEDTNWVCRDDRKMTQNYIVAWILSWITCGIYGLYWTYQLASRLNQAGDRYNVHIESPVIFTIVMHIPFLSYFYACDVMNNFADAYEKTAPQQTESQRDYYCNLCTKHPETAVLFPVRTGSCSAGIHAGSAHSASDCRHSYCQDTLPSSEAPKAAVSTVPASDYRSGYIPTIFPGTSAEKQSASPHLPYESGGK